MSKKSVKQKGKQPGGGDAVARMNHALQSEYNTIRALAAQADHQDALARHEIALHCHTVCEGDGQGGTYGDRAVVRLSKALGWSKSTVYEYAVVAATWPDKQVFAQFAEQEDRYGKPLSWSHIVLLAAVADTGRRNELVKDAIKHGWNVRDLRKELRGGTPKQKAKGAAPADAESKLPRVLATAVQNYVAQVAGLKANATVFGEHLVQKIKQAEPADLTDAVVDRLTKARQNLWGLVQQLDEYIEQAQQRRMMASQPPDDRQGPAADPLEDQFYDGQQERAGDALVGTP